MGYVILILMIAGLVVEVVGVSRDKVGLVFGGAIFALMVAWLGIIFKIII